MAAAIALGAQEQGAATMRFTDHFVSPHILHEADYRLFLVRWGDAVDAERFDRWTRGVAAGRSRRGALRVLAGSVLGIGAVG
jgi:hypothetical protein